MMVVSLAGAPAGLPRAAAASAATPGAARHAQSHRDPRPSSTSAAAPCSKAAFPTLWDGKTYWRCPARSMSD